MTREIKYKIAAHPVQQAILDLVVDTRISELSLRAIARKIGVKNDSPQMIKHHLTQMVKYGFLDIVGGVYKIGNLLTD